ncbi:MAG: type VI secretion system tip protein TssI/VgrG [Spongiibacteraceae bacterium]
MPVLNQDKRLLRIDTPVGKDAFVAVELYGSEANSSLFQFQVDLISTNFEIKPADIVGQKVTASIYYNADSTRYINAVVSEFCAFGIVDGVRRYTATLVPALWLLGLNQGSAVYADKTTKEIISELLKRAAIDFKYEASANDKREYCIQYEETELEFFDRLIAEEGLSYYFIHQSGKHELIIIDKNSQYVDCAELIVECEDENAGAGSLLSRITQWNRHYKMHSGALTMTGYLESAPAKGQSVEVHTRNTTISTLSKFSREVYDSAVPYGFADELPKYGDKITQKKTAELMLETEEGQFDTINGSSNCCTFLAGGRFELKHRLASEAGKYLLTGVDHHAISKNGAMEYSNTFVCVPAATLVHPAPPASRGRINGPQLATVIAVKAGDSPSASDPQLMVKVRFYWDEKSQSCWVRVMQNFARGGEGSVFVPRVDSEVVVEFIGGDPDRPLVTGAVYNAENLAPQYSKTQSGFKTGGSNFNELRFDDKAEAEEIYLKAGKDFNFLVMNDETGEIKNNQTLTVDKDRSDTVKGNEERAVKGNQKSTIEGDGSYKSNKTITMEAATSITLKVGGNSIVIDTGGITMKGVAVKVTADTSLALKGSASADVKTNGILSLKGALTKVN